MRPGCSAGRTSFSRCRRRACKGRSRRTSTCSHPTLPLTIPRTRTLPLTLTLPLKADLDLLYANARVLQLLGAATALAVRRNAPRLPSRNTSRSRPAGVVTAELSDVVATLRSAILEERLDLRSRQQRDATSTEGPASRVDE